MYNYYDAMRSDLLDKIAWNYSLDEILEKLEDSESWKEELNDDCWADDSITGNASGSYTFNSYKARDYVCDNDDLCREALTEFCCESDSIAEHFLSGDWEYFDVTIRCYILNSAIDSLIDDLESCRDALEAENEINRERLEEIIDAA